jgi:hypothetical protein
MVWVLPSFVPQAALTVPELLISLSSTGHDGIYQVNLDSFDELFNLPDS